MSCKKQCGQCGQCCGLCTQDAWPKCDRSKALGQRRVFFRTAQAAFRAGQKSHRLGPIGAGRNLGRQVQGLRLGPQREQQAQACLLYTSRCV